MNGLPQTGTNLIRSRDVLFLSNYADPTEALLEMIHHEMLPSFGHEVGLAGAAFLGGNVTGLD